jgi:hypothetical protein
LNWNNEDGLLLRLFVCNEYEDEGDDEDEEDEANDEDEDDEALMAFAIALILALKDSAADISIILDVWSVDLSVSSVSISAWWLPSSSSSSLMSTSIFCSLALSSVFSFSLFAILYILPSSLLSSSSFVSATAATTVLHDGFVNFGEYIPDSSCLVIPLLEPLIMLLLQLLMELDFILLLFIWA